MVDIMVATVVFQLLCALPVEDMGKQHSFWRQIFLYIFFRSDGGYNTRFGGKYFYLFFFDLTGVRSILYTNH